METEFEKMMRRLEEWGASPREAVARMLDDQSLYRKLLAGFLDDKDFEQLEEMVKEHDYEKAFQIAHKMKGSVLFLNLTPISRELSVLTELLRPFYEKDTEGLPDREEEILRFTSRTGIKWRELCSIAS